MRLQAGLRKPGQLLDRLVPTTGAHNGAATGRGGRDAVHMVIERFNNRDAEAAYRRLRAQGRGVREEPRYVDSWVEATSSAASS